MQIDLSTVKKLDERKWKEKRKYNYLFSQTLKRNVHGEEILTLVGEIFTENCYEASFEDIYNTGNYQKFEE